MTRLVSAAIGGEIPGRSPDLVRKRLEHRRRRHLAALEQTARMAQAAKLHGESEPVVRATVARNPGDIGRVERAMPDHVFGAQGQPEQPSFVIWRQQRGWRRGRSVMVFPENPADLEEGQSSRSA